MTPSELALRWDLQAEQYPVMRELIEIAAAGRCWGFKDFAYRIISEIHETLEIPMPESIKTIYKMEAGIPCYEEEIA